MAPALFLTALDQMHEKLAAFAAGADDYLTKPFEVAELMVRVEDARPRRLPLARLASGELVLDPARHSVVYADAGVLLTPTEFRPCWRRSRPTRGRWCAARRGDPPPRGPMALRFMTTRWTPTRPAFGASSSGWAHRPAADPCGA